jgi:hypothetical protein
MAYKARRERKRGGGVKAKMQEYDAQGSNEMRETSDHSDGFREGGKVEGKEARKHMGKRARGGHVGVKHHHDHDGKGHTSIAVHHHNHKKGGEVEKRARGGGVRGMRGGAPFSSGKSLTSRSEMGEKTGPGEQAPIEG